MSLDFAVNRLPCENLGQLLPAAAASGTTGRAEYLEPLRAKGAADISAAARRAALRLRGVAVPLAARAEIHARAVLAVFAAAGLTGCGVSSELDRGAWDLDPPRTIALLPFHATDPDPEEGERTAYVRQVFFEKLAQLPYGVLSLERTDAALRRAGLSGARENGTWDVAQLALLGVDAVFAGEIDAYAATDVALFAHESVSGRFRLLAVPGGAALWEASYTYRNVGGLAWNSGQVIDAVRRFANSSDDIYVSAVDEFAERVLAAFPGDGTAPPPRDLSIASFEVAPSREGILGLGDRIDFRVVGTPGMQVEVVLAPGRQLSLIEIAPGDYRGTHFVVRGEEQSGVPSTARLVSPFGDAAERIADGPAIAIDSRPSLASNATASATQEGGR